MRVKNVNGISYDSNAYLIDAKRKTLVDAGMNAGHVMQNVTGLDLIILTHYHFDHIGAVPEVVRSTGAKVAMHEMDAALLHKDTSAAMFNAKRPEFEVDIILKDGEQVDLGDIRLEVIHTPGHTPGSICLYDKESKMLFTGDTVFENGSFGRTDIGGDSAAMVRSLKRLTELDVSAFYPGHGGAVSRNAKDALLASYNNAKYMLE